MATPSDIRLASKDAHEYRRFRQNKAKWAHGVRPLPGDKEFRPDGRCRPSPVPSLPPGAKRCVVCFPKERRKYGVGASKAGQRLIVDDDITSRDHYEDADHPEEVPEPQTGDVYYSFDATRSPTHGQDTLSVALNQALDRFDVKETERLVREYDVISQPDTCSEAGGNVLDDEDYELVDYLNA